MTIGTHSPCTAAWWRPPSKPSPDKVWVKKEMGCKPFQLGKTEIAVPKNNCVPAVHLAADGTAAGWVAAFCSGAQECHTAQDCVAL